MKHKKSDLTSFAKECAYAHHQFLNVACIAEEITKTDIGRELRNGIDNELLLEISRRYAKHVKNNCTIDIDTGETQECQDIINEIIECCEEHNWFQ